MNAPLLYKNKNSVVIVSILLILGVINISSFIMWLSVGDDLLSNMGHMIRFYLMEFVSSCVVIFLFYKAISVIQKHTLKFSINIVSIFFVSLLFAVITGWRHYAIKGFVWPDKRSLLYTENTLWYSLSQLGILFAFASIYYLVENWFELRKEKEKALEAVSSAKEARLQMLRYQLNPHFLFNALNSVRALIEDDKAKARIIVTELSEFLRYSLVHTQDGMVPLRREMDAINNFLDIQKIRFENKLKIELNIDPNIADVNIPCFLIHPLVENAVKYGMKTSSIPLHIIIEIQLIDECLEIKVSNSGHLTNGHTIQDKPPSGTGTGIQNVRQRLEHVYENGYSFTLTEESEWVHAHIRINLKDAGRSQ
jgi:LytS/YehU family sensor histidine kinase